MLFLLLGIITVVCTLAQDTSIELGIISCDQSRTYQDYDVNCLAGGTGVISCNDPLWGYFSPLSPPPDTCEVGTDRRPFGALTLEAQADFWIEIVKMPPDMQAGANETMYCHIQIRELPGTDKVSWWLGVGLQDAWSQNPDKPPTTYFKDTAMTIGCTGATFY